MNYVDKNTNNYAQIIVDGNGITINSTLGNVVCDTDIEFTPNKGIILEAPDGGKWRITVDNLGNLITTLI